MADLTSKDRIEGVPVPLPPPRTVAEVPRHCPECGGDGLMFIHRAELRRIARLIDTNTNLINAAYSDPVRKPLMEAAVWLTEFADRLE